MKPHAYYNEIDPYAALWIENLILEGVVAYGDVDRRSIEDVRPRELAGYTQCHFFAGLGGWSHALRLAGWPDERPVWTGSCPCQPFSAAGKGRGFADERHLWPSWFQLISQCRPVVVFGEQVASPDGLGWLDLVQADMEGSGYAFAAKDLCAAGVGAPHIRQRLYWVAESSDQRREGKQLHLQPGPARLDLAEARRSGGAGGVADSSSTGLEKLGEQQTWRQREAAQRGGAVGLLGDTHGARPEGCSGSGLPRTSEGGRSWTDSASNASTVGLLGNTSGGGSGRDGGAVLRAQEEGYFEWLEARRVANLPQLAGGVGNSDSQRKTALRRVFEEPRTERSGGFWSSCDWISCRDGKARPVEPGTFPLAHGVPARVGRLRAYGNAICAPLAAEFVRAYDETR